MPAPPAQPGRTSRGGRVRVRRRRWPGSPRPCRGTRRIRGSRQAGGRPAVAAWRAAVPLPPPPTWRRRPPRAGWRRCRCCGAGVSPPTAARSAPAAPGPGRPSGPATPGSGAGGGTGRGRRRAAPSSHWWRRYVRTPRGRTRSCTPRRRSSSPSAGWRRRRPRGPSVREESGRPDGRGVRGRSSPSTRRGVAPTDPASAGSAGRKPPAHQVAVLPEGRSPAEAGQRGNPR